MSSVFDRRHFLPSDKALLNRFLELSGSTNSVVNDLPHVLLRVNTISLPGNIDTFILSTSADPSDTIQYTSVNDVVDLSIRDGGFF